MTGGERSPGGSSSKKTWRMEGKDGANPLYLRGDLSYIRIQNVKIDSGFFSSLSIFSQLKDHLTRDFVELNSRGRDIQEIIGEVLLVSKKD